MMYVDKEVQDSRFHANVRVPALRFPLALMVREGRWLSKVRVSIPWLNSVNSTGFCLLEYESKSPV